MPTSDQGATWRFLSSLVDGQIPEIIETHISIVFLYPGRVFKLKKAVRFPYLDFSDPDKRLRFCQRELELNRRTAPGIYRAVRRIVRRADSSLAFDEEGALVDAVVEMVRFEQEFLFDAMARAGKLDDRLADALACHIAGFHANLPAIPGKSGYRIMLNVHEGNVRAFAATPLAGHRDVADLIARVRRSIEENRDALEERGKAGKIRRCHGDLHLRNICLFDGAPALFDCLEFDEDLAVIDVLYDIAFLLMDLWHVGLPQTANRFHNRYLDMTADTGSLGVMPLYFSMRSAVRAHVLAAAGNCEEAQSYIDLARSSLDISQPRLIAIGGLSGSGKSTAAAAIAPFTGPVPGARILSTDRIRKALSGSGPLERLPQEAYSAEMSARVYARQREETLAALDGGAAVIADGVFLREEERTAIAAIAREAGVGFAGFWLQAPVEQLVARVDARWGDPSDATASVVRQQSSLDAGEVLWTKIDAHVGVAKVAREILGQLDG